MWQALEGSNFGPEKGMGSIIIPSELIISSALKLPMLCMQTQVFGS